MAHIPLVEAQLCQQGMARTLKHRLQQMSQADTEGKKQPPWNLGLNYTGQQYMQHSW